MNTALASAFFILLLLLASCFLRVPFSPLISHCRLTQIATRVHTEHTRPLHYRSRPAGDGNAQKLIRLLSVGRSACVARCLPASGESGWIREPYRFPAALARAAYCILSHPAGADAVGGRARGVFNTDDCKLFLAAPSAPNNISSVEIYSREAAAEMR